MIESAGTLSPLSRYTISPTTNSSILIVSLFEFLSTFTFIIEFSSFKDSDIYETTGIFIAIFLATIISSLSEYGSEKAFEKLK